MVFIMFPFVHLYSFFHLCMKIITFYSVCASSSWVYSLYLSFYLVRALSSWVYFLSVGLLIFILSFKSCVFKMIILVWVFLIVLITFLKFCAYVPLWYFKISVESYIPPFSLSCFASFSCLLCAILNF